MSEDPSKQLENNDKEQKNERFITLARELSESQESFPFPGIDPESYANTKSSEEKTPGYATPIDALVERFENEGIKVALVGECPNNDDVLILPSGSDDIESDSVFPRFLQINETMDERLKELILLNKGQK